MPAPKSENWLRGRKRLGKMVEWQRREERLQQCLAWKAHIPGLLDPGTPVQRVAKGVLAEDLDPEKRSERQLMRVISDIRSHYGDISENDIENSSLSTEKDAPGVVPWADFEEHVAENVALYREIVRKLADTDPETIPADTLLAVVHLLDKAMSALTKPRRYSMTATGEFGEE